jgi:hypothetical protein
MAVNKYDKAVRSDYVPLPMQELFGFGEVLRKNDEEAQTLSASLLDQYNVNALQTDAARRDEKILGLETQLDDLVKNHGSNPITLLSQMRGLKRSVNKELKQGELAAIQGNYNTAQEYRKSVDQMVKAGWSPSEAQQIVSKSISEFEGTNFKGAGDYTAFQGVQPVNYKDPQKWLTENLKLVEDNITSYVSGLTKQEQLAIQQGTLEKAFKENKLTQKTYDQIMSALSNMAHGDVDLRQSLEQKGSLNGQSGWGQIYNEGANGEAVLNKENPFIQQMSGYAQAGQKHNVETDIKVRTDEQAAAMYKKKLEDAIGFTIGDGNLRDLTSIEEWDGFKKELKESAGEVQQLQNIIKSLETNPNLKNSAAMQEKLAATKQTLEEVTRAYSRNSSFVKDELVEFEATTLSKEEVEALNILEQFGVDRNYLLGDKGSLFNSAEKDISEQLLKQVAGISTINLDILGIGDPTETVKAELARKNKISDEEAAKIVDNYVSAIKKKNEHLELKIESGDLRQRASTTYMPLGNQGMTSNWVKTNEQMLNDNIGLGYEDVSNGMGLFESIKQRFGTEGKGKYRLELIPTADTDANGNFFDQIAVYYTSPGGKESYKGSVDATKGEKGREEKLFHAQEMLKAYDLGLATEEQYRVAKSIEANSVLGQYTSKADIYKLNNNQDAKVSFPKNSTAYVVTLGNQPIIKKMPEGFVFGYNQGDIFVPLTNFVQDESSLNNQIFARFNSYSEGQRAKQQALDNGATKEEADAIRLQVENQILQEGVRLIRINPR